MKQPYVLAPCDRADLSVRTILAHQLRILRSNTIGVLEDEDVEFLHDLRVANRRTRTALSQIKGVLPSSVVDRFSPEFKWLGTVTGPCRDLDVTLPAVAGTGVRLGIEARTLDALLRFLDRRRGAEHDRVSKAIRSQRFRRLLEDWGQFLDSPSRGAEDLPLAAAPISVVSGPRILKAFKRIRKGGAGISSDVSAALLHQLRIDGKKLRYLLEFFSDLYDRAVVTRCIDELKAIQDILGEFNDTEVLLALTEEFAEARTPGKSVADGVGQLATAIAERQHELRIEFVDRFSALAREESRRLYKKTFKAR
jgi:CHAD domain-containing protein